MGWFDWIGGMNKIDAEWYKALRFLSKLSLDDYEKIEKIEKNKLRKKVSEEMEHTLETIGYIVFRNGITNIVTQKGLKELRDLEEIRRKDITLVSSVVAIMISIVAVILSIIAINNGA